MVVTEQVDKNQILLGLVCPKCKQKPSAINSGYRCVSCDVDFPSFEHGITAFFGQPDDALALAYINLYQAVKWWEQKTHQLTQTLKKSERKQVLLPLLKAYNDNKSHFTRWASWIESAVKPNVLLDNNPNVQRSAYGYNFNYLSRDWVDLPKYDQERKTIALSLERCLRLAPSRGKACIFGMGTGQIGLSLCNFFSNIWGIDNSFGQLAQYHDLLEQDIKFWDVNTKNQRHSKNLYKQCIASISSPLKSHAHKLRYIWADALNSPFKDAYFDWVISVYFSDVKPLPDLVKEVKRILKPGGYFLHCGPLQYHFEDIEYQFAYNEFLDYFLTHGFILTHESLTFYQQVVDHDSLINAQQYNDQVILLQLKA